MEVLAPPDIEERFGDIGATGINLFEGYLYLAPDDGVKVGASYEPTPEKIASVESFVSATGEDAALRKATYEESIGWYQGITADIFG